MHPPSLIKEAQLQLIPKQLRAFLETIIKPDRVDAWLVNSEFAKKHGDTPLGLIFDSLEKNDLPGLRKALDTIVGPFYDSLTFISVPGLLTQEALVKSVSHELLKSRFVLSIHKQLRELKVASGPVGTFWFPVPSRSIPIYGHILKKRRAFYVTYEASDLHGKMKFSINKLLPATVKHPSRSKKVAAL